MSFPHRRLWKEKLGVSTNIHSDTTTQGSRRQRSRGTHRNMYIGQKRYREKLQTKEAEMGWEAALAPLWPSSKGKAPPGPLLREGCVPNCPQRQHEAMEEPQEVSAFAGSSRPMVPGWEYLVAIYLFMLLPASGSLPVPGPVQSALQSVQWGIIVDNFSGRLRRLRRGER